MHGLVRREHGFRQSSSPPPSLFKLGLPAATSLSLAGAYALCTLYSTLFGGAPAPPGLAGARPRRTPPPSLVPHKEKLKTLARKPFLSQSGSVPVRGGLIAEGGVPVSPGEGVEVPVRSQAQVDPGFQSDCVWSSDPICNDRVFLKTPQDPKGGNRDR